MDDDLLRARLGERFEQNLRAAAHEMHVEEHFGERPQLRDDRRAEGDVRHEMAVHDVEVQPFRAGLGGAVNVLGELAEIGGEQ